MRNLAILTLLLAFMAGCQSKQSDFQRMSLCPDSPNCVSSKETRESHHAPALAIAASERKAWLEDIINKQKRTKLVVNEDDYLRVEYTSMLFRFVDDVEFDLSDSELIHFRSASRVGYSDLGVNRKRIEDIREQLEAKQQ